MLYRSSNAYQGSLAVQRRKYPRGFDKYRRKHHWELYSTQLGHLLIFIRLHRTWAFAECNPVEAARDGLICFGGSVDL
jgi:hypothetical protein